ncbi:MAG: glycosyltransferase [Proteobacteria bacterium]|nr:glycosyltransferase [Pseudomonadota bacterium]MCP4916074.1 glycosyltransferase [Pseudomonadota bacterium]
MSAFELIIVGVYAACALALSGYGLHRYQMTWLYLRTLERTPRAVSPGRSPTVTVQLPVFNERFVVERLIESAARLDWPDLEVQVLDDSTDETTAIARACVDRLRAEGVDIVLVRRSDRVGFKAGALEHGAAMARGEFLAVFDADFVPPSDFLRRVMPYFADDVGMVQARWGHLNEADSLLTRLQAVLLDGHFVIEHTARQRSGRWFNFNGTAGVWRASTIADAGGWQHDTLTEDLDLSYRAQLAGWRFVYLPDLVVPAELPPSMTAFKSQQHRWAKGSIQTLKKLRGPLLAQDMPARVRLEAFVHLTNNLAYPLVVLLTLLTPAAVWVRSRHVESALWFDLVVFTLATVGVGLFYACSQWAVHSDWRERLLRIPAVMALGIGMAVNQSKAVLEALAGHESPFIRTPKFGDAPQSYALAKNGLPLVEILFGLYHLVGMGWAISEGYWPSVPIQLLFAAGFLSVGLSSLQRKRELAGAA